MSYTTTQQSLASELNLSTMTVSKALRGHPDISEVTRKKVLELARKRNYSPNLLAQSLLGKRTKMIGFVFPDLSYDFAHLIVQGAKDVLDKEGCLPIIALSSWHEEYEAKEIELMLGRRVEGLVCMPVPSGSGEAFERAVKAGVPVVFVGSRLDCSQASYVTLDSKKAVADVMDHLFGLGHKNITFIGPPEICNSMSMSLRLDTYIQIMTSAGLTPDSELVDVLDVNDIDRFIDALMAKRPIRTAVAAANDVIALKVMSRLMQRGYSIPKDIAITGIGGVAISELEMISLTTVQEYPREFGKMAAEILLQHMHEDKDKIKPVKKLVDGDLVIRRSTVSK